MNSDTEGGWVLLMVLLLLLLVALPLSFLQQEWYFLTRQQGASINQLQATLNVSSLSQLAAELQGDGDVE